jgi:hypothetical protein
MSQQALNRKIFIDDYVDPATIDVIDLSPVLQVGPKTGTVDDLYRARETCCTEGLQEGRAPRRAPLRYAPAHHAHRGAGR